MKMYFDIMHNIFYLNLQNCLDLDDSYLLQIFLYFLYLQHWDYPHWDHIGFAFGYRCHFRNIVFAK